MEKTRGGGESELMDLLISRRWLDMFGPFTKDPATIEWTKT
jgi:ethylbenzene hydroxylase subunit beta/complex iron-sulfur molybdoenzyme family reductase subunit beta